MFAAAAATAFVYYLFSYLKAEPKNWGRLCKTLVVVDYVLLLTNPITHLVFDYDGAGNYIHKELFILVAY